MYILHSSNTILASIAVSFHAMGVTELLRSHSARFVSAVSPPQG